MKQMIWIPVLAAAALAQPHPPFPPEPPALAPVIVNKPMPHLGPLPHPAPMPLKAMVAPGMFDKGFAMQPMFAFQHKDRAMEQAEREYERGMRALDRKQWDEAVSSFTEAASTGKPRADGALYWKAYALGKLGRSAEALSMLDTLNKTFPQSRWLNDAAALKVEISQAAGKPLAPEEEQDNEIKLMAINGLMHSDPERSVPLLENLLRSKSSPKLRERALFVLSQSDSTRAREVVARVAKGEFNPDLQIRAVNNLGVHGGNRNQQLLSDIYASSKDVAVKRAVLRSFMVSGNRERVFAAAKSEQMPELRSQAIQLLGAMGAGSQLGDLYSAETSPDIREQLMRALFTSGSTARLIELAKTERDPKLRLRAIQLLGTSPREQTGDTLVAMYSSGTEPEVRKAVIKALMVQNNARQLVEIARKESDPELKRQAVQQLSHMQSKEATDYMLELLK
ncbi:MAG TPA: HEAT repeat domain-containing protein [Bryobacteraceae bacterium]|nr:HEAT repeat domain-containing protein [Bryobacteraceae bacterium]